MIIIQEKDGFFVLRFSKGEEFKKTLEVFLKERSIRGGFFYGLGGAEAATLNYYDLEKKAYVAKRFFGEHFEVATMSGNVAQKEGEYVIHAHATLANKDFVACGGDVSELTVGGTLEIFLTILDPLQRKLDEETGLSLLTQL